MTIKSVVAATALAALMAAPAFAQQGGGRMQRTPEEMEAAFVKGDANKDGKLDKAEFKTTLPEQFQSMIDDERLTQIVTMRDTDKDGFLSKAEFSAPMQRPPQ
jgi:Ca2+-binding EF-hand superfamily protein